MSSFIRAVSQPAADRYSNPHSPLYGQYPVSTSTATDAQADTSTESDAAAAESEETNTADDSQTRAANLLSNNRGRLSTILTSYRGILTPSDVQPRRKTLLGE